MKRISKIFILFLKKLEIGSAIAVRLTKLTGKSKEAIHPKHFLNQAPWFTNYINSKDTILDIGCGNGQTAIKTAKYAKKVIGIDIDKSLLDIAQKSARRFRISNVQFKLANLEKKLRFNMNTFDEIIFLDVLEHLHNRDQILTEIRRLLRPGGLLFLGVPNSQTSWKKLQRRFGVNSFSDPDHKVEFSEVQVRNLLKKHGFKIENLGYGVYDTPLRGLIDIIGGFSLKAYKKLSLWRKNKARFNPKEASGFEVICRKLK